VISESRHPESQLDPRAFQVIQAKIHLDIYPFYHPAAHGFPDGRTNAINSSSRPCFRVIYTPTTSVPSGFLSIDIFPYG